MKIRCERCRARIDTNKHDFCPKCGANFYTDIAFEEPKPDESCINTISAETNKPSAEARQPQQTNKKKNGCTTIGCGFSVVLVGGLILTELIAGIYYTVKENIKSEVIEESEETVYTVPVSEEYPVLVSEGNKAYTEKFTIACDMTTEVDFGSIPPDEGNIYLAFHITVDNISEKSSCNFGIPSCFADGVECSMIPFTDKGIFLVTGLGAGESYEGWAVFEVPSDAEHFELNFDDEVIIYKENILNEEE